MHKRVKQHKTSSHNIYNHFVPVNTFAEAINRLCNEHDATAVHAHKRKQHAKKCNIKSQWQFERPTYVIVDVLLVLLVLLLMMMVERLVTAAVPVDTLAGMMMLQSEVVAIVIGVTVIAGADMLRAAIMMTTAVVRFVARIRERYADQERRSYDHQLL